MLFFVFRHAYNISIKDLTVMLFKSLLEQPLLGNASLTPPQLVKILQDVSWDAYEN